MEKVIWEKEARQTFGEILEYRYLVAGETSTLRLRAKIVHVVELLATFPLMGHFELALEHRSEGFRSFMADRRYKIIYRIAGEQIIVVALFDCRQHPDKMLR